MEPSFITIAEACERTGKSASTIRRLIHTITQDDKHADRAAIEPSPKQVAVFKKKDENFTWKIREDVIEKNFSGAPTNAKKSKAAPTGDIFAILEKELELKNQQIEKQWEVIHALNDRLREGNILMGSLQKRLGPPPSESPAAESVMETVAASASVDATEKHGKKKLRWWRR